MMPLPQSRVQTLGSPTQVYPLSTRQALLQPSPFCVSLSSQSSPASSAPLPHSWVQTLGSPLHVHPPSTMQVAEQPSPSSVSPSSQVSSCCTTPSPHSLPQLPLAALPSSRKSQSRLDRKSTRLNSSHLGISYAVFCLK